MWTSPPESAFLARGVRPFSNTGCRFPPLGRSSRSDAPRAGALPDPAAEPAPARSGRAVVHGHHVGEAAGRKPVHSRTGLVDRAPAEALEDPADPLEAVAGVDLQRAVNVVVGNSQGG